MIGMMLRVEEAMPALLFFGLVIFAVIRFSLWIESKVCRKYAFWLTLVFGVFGAILSVMLCNIENTVKASNKVVESETQA